PSDSSLSPRQEHLETIRAGADRPSRWCVPGSRASGDALFPRDGRKSCNVTVAQGMEGDGKKEDLTVLGGTSTHRTPKVRSSMELLQRLRQRYLQFLQVVVDVLEGGTHYRDFEDRLRQELDALGRDIVK